MDGTIQPREREREREKQGNNRRRARWREGAEDKKAKKKKKGEKKKISKEEESVGRGHYRASLVYVYGASRSNFPINQLTRGWQEEGETVRKAGTERESCKSERTISKIGRYLVNWRIEGNAFVFGDKFARKTEKWKSFLFSFLKGKKNSFENRKRLFNRLFFSSLFFFFSFNCNKNKPYTPTPLPKFKKARRPQWRKRLRIRTPIKRRVQNNRAKIDKIPPENSTNNPRRQEPKNMEKTKKKKER